MILIADSGSTKTDWVLLGGDKESRLKTIGYNPYFVNTENIYRSLSEQLVPQLDPLSVTEVNFYGAGCSTPENKEIVHKALTRCFINARVMVGHDMLAAARAVLGDEPGFAAIIGTGSNTCLYNGNEVEMNIDSLGYLLGDEGSGSYIGKKVVRDFMRGYLPAGLAEKFTEKYGLTNDEIFNTLYNKPLPNRFLASFCMFADEHKNHEYMRNIVREAFTDFFKNLVTRYPGFQNYTFNCIGSVGFVFRDILSEVSEKHGMKAGVILHSPIDNLVQYHKSHSLKESRV
jgi:glucosamine kinase